VEGYDRVVSQAPGWYGVVRGSGVGVALVDEHSPLAAGLAARGWVASAADDGYVLMSRST
jgi:hypothetical protein